MSSMGGSGLVAHRTSRGARKLLWIEANSKEELMFDTFEYRIYCPGTQVFFDFVPVALILGIVLGTEAWRRRMALGMKRLDEAAVASWQLQEQKSSESR